MFALAWSLQLVPEPLDFGQAAPGGLIHAVPHPPPHPNGVADALARARLRETATLVQALDIAFCLHWGAVASALRRSPLRKALPGWVVVERRRALEWLLGRDDWDEVSLDT